MQATQRAKYTVRQVVAANLRQSTPAASLVSTTQRAAVRTFGMADTTACPIAPCWAASSSPALNAEQGGDQMQARVSISLAIVENLAVSIAAVETQSRFLPSARALVTCLLLFPARPSRCRHPVPRLWWFRSGCFFFGHLPPTARSVQEKCAVGVGNALSRQPLAPFGAHHIVIGARHADPFLAGRCKGRLCDAQCVSRYRAESDT